MNIGKAILYVLAVLAIMVVSGLIIYVLSGIVVSVIDKKSVNLFGSKKESAQEKEKIEPSYLLEDSKEGIKQIEQKPQLVSEEPVEQEGAQIDFDLAESEKRAIAEQRNNLAERERVVEQAQEQQEEPEDEDINDLYAKLIAEINAEATDQEEVSEDEEDEDFISDELVAEDDVVAEEVEEPVEESVEEEAEIEEVEEVVEETPVAEEEPAEVEEVEEQEPEIDEEKEDLKNLVAELQAKLAKEQEEKQELSKLVETTQTEVVETESVEALTARKELLQQRLSQAEKDLKANKKEYIPLLRIQKTLESDKAKLRRKEAVVAKQKVVLFGVNNYVVDPEKQKKLSEDLDVLNALRLSVQHCEEVIKDNESRYPILEKTNGILTKQVADLKADIADIETRIQNATDNSNDAE